MFCYQCQEAAGNTGCTVKGVCGKDEPTANLMDLLVHTLRGIGVMYDRVSLSDTQVDEAGRFITDALFATITNTNFDPKRIEDYIDSALVLRDRLKREAGLSDEDLPDAAVWSGTGSEAYRAKAAELDPTQVTENADIRSLRELILYGLKGLAAYTSHARILGHENRNIYRAVLNNLAATTKELSSDELTSLVLETGNTAVKAMELLDTANTSAYGTPEITQVNLGVRSNPGILISGHDLKDMEELLRQTEGTGVDVYTHSEMLPANYYPVFKKYEHFVGNYGNSWWKQNKEFEAFNGPVVMTTNCITPVKESYKERVFTTHVVGYPGLTHIPERSAGGEKDFSEVIEMAKRCDPPTELETGELTGGFAHKQVEALADKIVDAVKSGSIRRFVVMAGCDGRHGSRSYFTEVAEELPKDAIILTAGCAKYRYNKLNLGSIDGIPRVLDAGQCNDSYSLAIIAMKLKEAFGVADINELPISFDLAWYEQKAVAVLLALLALGFKGIRLGPTLPAFLTENVAEVLVNSFDLKPIDEAKSDVEAMMAGA